VAMRKTSLFFEPRNTPIGRVYVIDMEALPVPVAARTKA
jgi:hypothetical protein